MIVSFDTDYLLESDSGNVSLNSGKSFIKTE